MLAFSNQLIAQPIVQPTLRETLAPLAQARVIIGVTAGGPQEAVLSANYPARFIRSFRGIVGTEEGFLPASPEDVSAFINQDPRRRAAFTDGFLPEQIAALGLQSIEAPLPQAYQSLGRGFIFDRTCCPLMARVAQALEQAVANGTYQRLIEQVAQDQSFTAADRAGITRLLVAPTAAQIRQFIPVACNVSSINATVNNGAASTPQSTQRSCISSFIFNKYCPSAVCSLPVTLMGGGR